MVILVKIAWFQIIQNLINLKWTLVFHYLMRNIYPCYKIALSTLIFEAVYKFDALYPNHYSSMTIHLTDPTLKCSRVCTYVWTSFNLLMALVSYYTTCLMPKVILWQIIFELFFHLLNFWSCNKYKKIYLIILGKLEINHLNSRGLELKVPT